MKEHCFLCEVRVFSARVLHVKKKKIYNKKKSDNFFSFFSYYFAATRTDNVRGPYIICVYESGEWKKKKKKYDQDVINGRVFQRYCVYLPYILYGPYFIRLNLIRCYAYCTVIREDRNDKYKLLFAGVRHCYLPRKYSVI